RMLMSKRGTVTVANGFERLLAAEILTDCDEFHFRRHNSAPGVVQLGDRGTCPCPQRLAAEARKLFKLALSDRPGELFGIFRQVAIVSRCDLAPLVLLDVAPSNYPIASERRQSVPDIALDRRVSPDTTRIIGHDWSVGFAYSIDASRRVLADLAK